MKNSQKNELVVKDNALINASYNLELIEQRIILLAILQIRKIGDAEIWMPFDSQIEICADDYAKAFGTTRQASYIALKEACKTLFNRQFSYQEIDKSGKVYTVTARWVSRIFYADDEASIKLDFTHYVIPLVTELEKRFTSYELRQVSNITSAYGLRLYELVMAWKNTGKTPGSVSKSMLWSFLINYHSFSPPPSPLPMGGGIIPSTFGGGLGRG